MKLSEAIALGSMITPQAIGTFEDARGARCALAAAADAVGKSVLTLYSYDGWTWIKGINSCPACGGKAPTAEVISHLNDRHGWTRIRIARWVAEIEPCKDVS
jgi:hypothetical protein